jgi:hypothetical protein
MPALLTAVRCPSRLHGTSRTWTHSRPRDRAQVGASEAGDIALPLKNKHWPPPLSSSLLAPPPGRSACQKNLPPLRRPSSIACTPGIAYSSRTSLTRLRHLSPLEVVVRAAFVAAALPWPPSSSSARPDHLWLSLSLLVLEPCLPEPPGALAHATLARLRHRTPQSHYCQPPIAVPIAARGRVLADHGRACLGHPRARPRPQLPLRAAIAVVGHPWCQIGRQPIEPYLPLFRTARGKRR